MNRMNSLGPLPGKRSRGELVLEALDHADAREAAEALAALEPGHIARSIWSWLDNRDASGWPTSEIGSDSRPYRPDFP